MKKTMCEKIDEWLLFNKHVMNIYNQIIECEKSGLLKSKEHQNLLIALSCAINIEKSKFLDLGLNEHTKDFIQNNADIKQLDETRAFFDGDIDLLTQIRKNCRFLHELYYINYGFYAPKETYGLSEYFKDQNDKEFIDNFIFYENYFYILNTNFIVLIERYLNKLNENIHNEKKTHDALIYLKYAVIATSLKYEEEFIKLNGKTLPAKNIFTSFPPDPNRTNQELQKKIEELLETTFIQDINRLVQLSYYNVSNCMSCEINQLLILCQAILISHGDINFIKNLEQKIQGYMEPNGLNYNILYFINEMLKDTYLYLEQNKKGQILNRN